MDILANQEGRADYLKELIVLGTINIYSSTLLVMLQTLYQSYRAYSKVIAVSMETAFIGTFKNVIDMDACCLQSIASATHAHGKHQTGIKPATYRGHDADLHLQYSAATAGFAHTPMVLGFLKWLKYD